MRFLDPDLEDRFFDLDLEDRFFDLDLDERFFDLDLLVLPSLLLPALRDLPLEVLASLDFFPRPGDTFLDLDLDLRLSRDRLLFFALS